MLPPSVELEKCSKEHSEIQISENSSVGSPIKQGIEKTPGNNHYISFRDDQTDRTTLNRTQESSDRDKIANVGTTQTDSRKG